MMTKVHRIVGIIFTLMGLYISIYSFTKLEVGTITKPGAGFFTFVCGTGIFIYLCLCPCYGTLGLCHFYRFVHFALADRNCAQQTADNYSVHCFGYRSNVFSV